MSLEELKEEWRPVVGYEGWYSVSSLGRVRSEERIVKGNANQSGRKFGSKIMRQWTHDCGYLLVDLKRDGLRRHCRVHRLVAEAFLGPPPSDKHEPFAVVISTGKSLLALLRTFRESTRRRCGLSLPEKHGSIWRLRKMTINYKALAEPFAASDIEWRIGQAGKKQDGSIWAKVLAYVTARAIEDRLDAVVGPQNWRNEFQFVTGGVLCGISINTENGWITKWDGSDPSDIEAFKGSISGAMKRAAVQWGIGRYLYDLGETWAAIVNQNTEGAHYANCKVKVQGKEEWAQFYWLPPRGALEPKQEQETARPLPAKPQKTPAKPTAKQVAAEHGMKTADQLPGVETTYQKALKEIEKAVKTHDKAHLKKVAELVTARHKEGLLTDNEDATLVNELVVAERKIDAVLSEPAAA